MKGYDKERSYCIRGKRSRNCSSPKVSLIPLTLLRVVGSDPTYCSSTMALLKIAWVYVGQEGWKT